ncbi:MAG: hypothetical protein SFU56_01980 [Capsulimonadales bacterium]|nr:hypothetical protein [Capsulimonadales bacterium]
MSDTIDQESTGPSPTTDPINRDDNDEYEQVESVHDEQAKEIVEEDEEAALDRLFTELNVKDFPSALAAIRRLKEKARRPSDPPVDADTEAAAPAEGGDLRNGEARKMLEKFRAFSSRIDSLNGTIASMEEQLRNLYADRERLEREIGASEVDDVISTFSALYLTIINLETQLAALYADREYLDTELGKSDPIEIVAMFKNVSQMVNGAHRELLASGA